MSDLISRSKLIKTLEEYKEKDWNKKLCTMLPNVVDDCIDFIENMPTAYDIDGVIEDVRCRCYEIGLDESQTEIIVNEIVKQGSVRKDVE